MSSPVAVRPAVAADVPGAARLASELVRLHHRFDPDRFMLIEPVEDGYRRFLAGQIGRRDAVFLVAVREERSGAEDAAGSGLAEGSGEATGAAGAAGRLAAGEVVGYLLAGLEGRDWMDLRDACGKLYDLYVDPAVRGGGVGLRLVEEGLRRLSALGAPQVVLMTAWGNEPAQRLFERAGFRRTMLEMTRER